MPEIGYIKEFCTNDMIADMDENLEQEDSDDENDGPL